jgi:glucose-1-phosphate cytidylyltransferase
MKVVIFAGGYGSRLTEKSSPIPKPMIDIGGQPLIWHILKIYSHYGFNDFVVCCGYKGFSIKDYFANYFLHNSDITFDFSDNGKMEIHNNNAEQWKVTLVETGIETMTGGRLKRVRKYIGDEPFMLTYGDGVSDVNIPQLIDFHNKNKTTVTITAHDVSQKFGVVKVDENGRVTEFREKSDTDSGLINAGFMVVEPDIFDELGDDDCILEREVLERLSMQNRLTAYMHKGFWKCIDTPRDYNEVMELWNGGNAPWKLWD